jgi:prefoldin subunit 5
MAQTSDRVSKLAARYAKLTSETLRALAQSQASLEATADEIRSLAASALRQDEVKGLRKLFKKVVG